MRGEVIRGCQATDAEYRAHRRGHPCPFGMACRTTPACGGTLAACCRGEDRADTLTATGAFRLASTPYLGLATFRFTSEKFLGGALSAGSRELVSALSHHHPRRQEQSKSIATQFAPRHRIRLRPDVHRARGAVIAIRFESWIAGAGISDELMPDRSALGPLD